MNLFRRFECLKTLYLYNISYLPLLNYILTYSKMQYKISDFVFAAGSVFFIIQSKWESVHSRGKNCIKNGKY